MNGELFLTKLPVSILHVLIRFELEETSLNWSYLEKTTQEDQNQTSDVIEHGANVWLTLFNTFYFALTFLWSLSYCSENAWRTTATSLSICPKSMCLNMRHFGEIFGTFAFFKCALICSREPLLYDSRIGYLITICELKQKVQIWLLHVKSIWIKRTASLPNSVPS